MTDNEFLKPAMDLYRDRLIEESKLGWPTLLAGIFLYIAWIFFAQPSFATAALGLAVMWIMRLLHEMRKIQHINNASVEFVIAQNRKILDMLLQQEYSKRDK